MKLLFASDSFKGTLSSKKVAEMLTVAAHEVFCEPQCVSVQMADGGEGSIDAIADYLDGEMVTCVVENPLSQPVNAKYYMVNESTAYIEMAQASGLTLIPQELRDPMVTSTYGTGQLIDDALRRGCTRIYVGIGGSATNDGGMGCMRALGVRFLDYSGMELIGQGKDLERVTSIDVSGMSPKAALAEFIVLCDVDNPLCGENGATMVFAKQKGASAAQMEKLENGMTNYRNKLRSIFGIDADNLEGAGAAGGLGAALMVFLKAHRKPGVNAIAEVVGLPAMLSEVDMVITGEGRVDEQSCHGKVLSGVGKLCKDQMVKAYAIVGSKGPGWEDIFDYGIEDVFCVSDDFSMQRIFSNPEATFLRTAVKMFQELKIKSLSQ